ncbi:hypothetical protein [Kribbia dieselivorans]|uniref:hypothetical protein n=1 Tax=Kribbia dieselivorans TaxID=331526 RepID=UPI000837BCEF|nr:hypothetical protein [Kribbia dieselivorans]
MSASHPGRRRAWAGAAAGAVVTLTVTACAGAGHDAPSAADPIATPTIASTPSESRSAGRTITAADRDRAIAQAEKVVRAWFPTVYRVLRDPNLIDSAAERARIGTVSKGRDQDALRREFTQMQANGERAEGKVTVVSVTPTQIVLDPPQPREATVDPYVGFDVCTDGTSLRVLGRDGREVPYQGGPKKQVFAMTVTNLGSAAKPMWRVTLQERTNRAC